MLGQWQCQWRPEAAGLQAVPSGCKLLNLLIKLILTFVCSRVCQAAADETKKAYCDKEQSETKAQPQKIPCARGVPGFWLFNTCSKYEDVTCGLFHLGRLLDVKIGAVSPPNSVDELLGHGIRARQGQVRGLEQQEGDLVSEGGRPDDHGREVGRQASWEEGR